VAGAAGRLKEGGVRVSLFVDPTEGALREAAGIGVDAVELHTGEYANARGDQDKGRELKRLAAAARLARERGLAVHAGHGLTYQNVLPVAALADIEELNIGHSIVSRAVLVGMERAVMEMRGLVDEAPVRVPEPGRWLPPVGY
jgi:pyridoxine 5-phosphate synthase